MKKIILSLTIMLFVFLTEAWAADNPQAMIVFDASGSMWGQINKTAKITIAKKALNKVVSDWDEKVHLGLITYGHRKKGDCDDIETLVPIGLLDKKDMIAKVKAIKPKGKTPISRSIKKAAEALKYTEEKATIILISDGKETCDADPCATAKALESEGIDFVTHVIGFDVDKQTDKQLKCIADATGGEYFSAKNASSLNDAMGKIVEKVQKAEPPKPVVKKLKFNLEITASETEDGKWVEARIGNSLNEEGEDVSIGTYATFKKKPNMARLPVGKYTLTDVTYSQYKKKSVPFEIKAGEVTKLHIVFGLTGQVAITASETEDGKWVEARIGNSLNEEGEDVSIGTYATFKKKSNITRLPVGKYTLIDVTYNEFKKKTVPFEVKAGEVTKLHIVFGQTGKVEITAVEKEGGKWVQASHSIYKQDDLEGSSIEGCNSYKKEACLEQIPVGHYVIKSRFNQYKQETPIEITAGELAKVQVVMGQTGKVEISAVEKEGGKWVQASHSIYKQDDLEGSSIEGCNSYKKEACLEQIPVGHYVIKSRFNAFKQETPLEITAGALTKVQIVMGQTGKVEISAVEKEDGKWVQASHSIYKQDDLEGSSIESCNSYKKEACLEQIPVGQYVIKSRFNAFKQETPLEITAGELTKVQIVMGQTGKVEVSSSEKADGKWVKGTHYIYQDDEGKAGDRAGDAHSGKKKVGKDTLPVGHYILTSSYNAFKQNTSFEIKAGEVTKLQIVFGQTGTVEVSSSEKAEGKWVKGTHYIYQDEEGKAGARAGDAHSGKKKAGKDTLPLGHYILTSSYNAFKKETPFVIKAGEVTKIHVVFGQTGSVEVSASEKAEGKWVKGTHYIYQNDEGKAGDRAGDAHSGKKKAGKDTLPVGHYILTSSYKGFKKETAFEVKAAEVTKLHIVFEQFRIEAKCSDMSSNISYEIYASNGRMVFEKQAKCSDQVPLSIENGDYTLESKVNNVTKETKFSIGKGQPSQISIDMSVKEADIEEESKEALIKSDRQSSPVGTQDEPQKAPTSTESENTEKKIKEDLNKIQKDMGNEMEQLGNMFKMIGKMSQEMNKTKEDAPTLSEDAKNDDAGMSMDSLEMFTK